MLSTTRKCSQKNWGYSKDFIDSKYQEIVDFSELHDFLEVPVRNFSSGMIARLAFSVATIVEPEILIVDEILSVGDLNFQKKSENKMRSLISGGTTVLYAISLVFEDQEEGIVEIDRDLSKSSHLSDALSNFPKHRNNRSAIRHFLLLR